MANDTSRDAARGPDKTARIPIKVDSSAPIARKPRWIRSTTGNSQEVERIKGILRGRGLHTVCEEASCPNLGECFSQGTATFMIMGDICTRRCPFCSVMHGRPQPLDPSEPRQLAETIGQMGLNYVVITSVDRDDLKDGGASQFAACIEQIRDHSPHVRIEILTPDFRSREERALATLMQHPADVFNHNLETVPRLYRKARPGADYHNSLRLLSRHRELSPETPTKSGLMLGIGESIQEVIEVLEELRVHDCSHLTLGQYLQPSVHHLPVERYLPPEEFQQLADEALAMGFTHVASGPMVRSSYHAERQAEGQLIR